MEEMAEAIQTRSKNIMILSLNLGSLCNESQSLVSLASVSSETHNLQCVFCRRGFVSYIGYIGMCRTNESCDEHVIYFRR